MNIQGYNSVWIHRAIICLGILSMAGGIIGISISAIGHVNISSPGAIRDASTILIIQSLGGIAVFIVGGVLKFLRDIDKTEKKELEAT